MKTPEPGGSERPLRLRVAENVRILRLLRKWSQERLAEAAGLGRSYVGGVERAEYNLGIDTLERLAAALGVETADLLSEPDPGALGEAVIRRIRAELGRGAGFRVREHSAFYACPPPSPCCSAPAKVAP